MVASQARMNIRSALDHSGPPGASGASAASAAAGAWDCSPPETSP